MKWQPPVEAEDAEVEDEGAGASCDVTVPDNDVWVRFSLGVVAFAAVTIHLPVALCTDVANILAYVLLWKSFLRMVSAADAGATGVFGTSVRVVTSPSSI